MSAFNFTFRNLERDEKVAHYGEFIFHFHSGNEFTVNIKPFLLKNYDLDDPSFYHHAKQIMMLLVKDYGCLPSIDINNAVEELIYLRRNDVAAEYRKSLEVEMTDLLAKRQSVIDKNIVDNEKVLQEAQIEVEAKFSESRVAVGQVQSEIADKMAMLKKTDDEQVKATLQKQIVDLQAKQVLKVGVLEKMSGEVVLIKNLIIEKQKENLKKLLDPIDSSLQKLQVSMNEKITKFCEKISSGDSEKIEKINKIIMGTDSEDEK